MVAYLQLRERQFLGARELLEDRRWSGDISWRDGKGYHRASHRPDLVASLPDAGSVAVEVELAQKSLARLRAIITLHAGWRAAGRSAGVLYVCGDQDGADRVTRAAESVAGPDWPGLAVRLLDSIQQQTIAIGEEHRAVRKGKKPRAIQGVQVPAVAQVVGDRTEHRG